MAVSRHDATPLTSEELVHHLRGRSRRWIIEEAFQAGKGLAGLDEHQVRCWTSWRRWTLMAMIGHALLAVLAATAHADGPAPAGMIALTCNEIRRLFTVLIIEPARALAFRWPGHTGDAAINTTPAPTTTSANTPPSHGHNDLQLEY